VASLWRNDHLGDPDMDLSTSVRRLVAEQSGEQIEGPVRLLTLWRSFGWYFSPVNFYYLFDSGERLQAMVAEVTNTPWRERHCYVLSSQNATDAGGHGFRHPKQFHVSPFLDLHLEYRWRVSSPSDALTVHLEACRDDVCQFDATLNLRRVELTRMAWLASVARYPVLPGCVLAGIYWEALRLWWNKAPFYPHPSKRPPGGTSRSDTNLVTLEAVPDPRRPAH
jgi:uncharacterized protein